MTLMRANQTRRQRRRLGCICVAVITWDLDSCRCQLIFSVCLFILLNVSVSFYTLVTNLFPALTRIIMPLEISLETYSSLFDPVINGSPKIQKCDSCSQRSRIRRLTFHGSFFSDLLVVGSWAKDFFFIIIVFWICWIPFEKISRKHNLKNRSSSG